MKNESVINLIEGIINKKLNQYLNYIYSFINNLFNQFKPNSKKNSSVLNLKAIKTIHNDKSVNSVMFLRNGKLISGGHKGMAVYHRHTFQSDFVIQDHYYVLSICELRNGNLAADCGVDIRIYEINGNNYHHIHTLKGHTDRVRKIIELEDGRLCSCSSDKTVKVWDNKSNYECIQTLEGHNYYVYCIIEFNNYIISSGNSFDKTVRIWDKYTYQSVKIIQNVYCCNNNGLAKLKENKIILGGNDMLFIIDIATFEYKVFKGTQLGNIWSVLVLKEDKILIGNNDGVIHYFDSLSNQIIFTQKVHDKYISCIIKSEENKIITSSLDGTIIIYEDLDYI